MNGACCARPDARLSRDVKKKKGKCEDNAEPEHSAVLRSKEPEWPSLRGQVHGSACGSHPNGWQTGETAQEAFFVINPLSRKTLHRVCPQGLAGWLSLPMATTATTTTTPDSRAMHLL